MWQCVELRAGLTGSCRWERQGKFVEMSIGWTGRWHANPRLTSFNPASEVRARPKAWNDDVDAGEAGLADWGNVSRTSTERVGDEQSMTAPCVSRSSSANCTTHGAGRAAGEYGAFLRFTDAAGLRLPATGNDRVISYTFYQTSEYIRLHRSGW
jgi:hypothetical protein